MMSRSTLKLHREEVSPQPKHVLSRSRNTRRTDRGVDRDLDLDLDRPRSSLDRRLGAAQGFTSQSPIFYRRQLDPKFDHFDGHLNCNQNIYRYDELDHTEPTGARFMSRSRSRSRSNYHRPSHRDSSYGAPVAVLAPHVMQELEQPLKRQRSNRSTRSTTSSARRRQNEDGCVTCLRGMLHCYNVFILIVGCAALAVGIWLLVTDFGARKVTPIVGNQLYEVTTYLLMAGGGAVALLAFCGCCGTIREDKCVLSFYGTTLAIVLIVLGASCGLALFFRTALESNIQVRMKKTLIEHYGIEVSYNAENRRVTEAWDAMQRQLKCCGITGNITSKESWALYKFTPWFSHTNRVRHVPDSCCAPGDVKICTGEDEFNGPPRFYHGFTKELIETNPYLYTDGCYDSLIKYLRTYSTVVAGVSAAVPLFLVFGIIISFCLCARVSGYSDDEVEL